jgi:hypothetical protein
VDIQTVFRTVLLVLQQALEQVLALELELVQRL